MRKLIAFASLLTLIVAPGPADAVSPSISPSAVVAGAAIGQRAIGIDTSKRVEFTDCSGTGSAAQTLTAGTYAFRVTDADVWLCFADPPATATCGSGGERWPVGTVINYATGTKSVACRSTGANGDAIFTGSI